MKAVVPKELPPFEIKERSEQMMSGTEDVLMQADEVGGCGSEVYELFS